MGEFAIRPSDEKDLQAVAALGRDRDLPQPGNDPESDIARCRATRESVLFVGESGERSSQR